ncbi:E3 ubiquitin-protein ligase MIB2-like [Tubulanus polymorphus]|uniref:E3 ubiquitin-protein ligase MIB2-like n=1 Tax=Tubulanus polymorphus TaxID=672921 RepID=UPI003DA28C31
MELGLRVVRGPDWRWSEQDGGEGHVGTIVEIGKPGSTTSPDKTVVVQWDSGSRTNYRVGYQNAYDLTIFDNAPVGIRHESVICDSCKKQHIMGIRWKCSRCQNFDLCTPCYMSDKHDTNHSFYRYDNPETPRVKVSKRSGSNKICSRGIFAGAKVVRGPDWDWGNQDGGEGRLGKVSDIRGWEGESGRSVACVSWVSGVTNVYRLGHKGKVDIKYITDAVGCMYYPDHLPVLGQVVTPSRSSIPRNQFKVGDNVRVDLEIDVLKQMQEGHGGWNPKMAEYIGKVGIVHRITERGDIRVQYEGCTNRWTFHAGALEKVQQFNVGDIVRVIDDQNLVKKLQKDHGEWTDQMKNALGRSGRVIKVYTDGDIRVQVSGHTWTFNPSCCDLEPLDINKSVSHTSLGALFQKIMDLQQNGPDILVREAAQGRMEVVQEIVTKHPDKIDQKSSGKTALQVASHQGHYDLVKMLLKSGANLECQDEDGDTALHYSAFGNQPDVMELLITKGAKVDALNNGECSSLHVAVNKQHAKCVKVLLKHNADVNIQDSYGDTALHDAICKENKDIVEQLITYENIDLALTNNRGFNGVHHAALKGNNHALQLILAKTDLSNVKKDDGFAALHLAALNGHKDVAETLIDVGHANMEIKNNRQQTPLLLAASQGHATLVDLLIKKGANMYAVDEDGDTCLHLAVVKLSVPPETDDLQDFKDLRSGLGLADDTPPNIVLACLLAQKGLRLTKKNKQHKTPLDLLGDHKIAAIIQNYASGAVAEEKVICMVCSDDEACITFDPCGHTVCCYDCCAKMKKCISCQEVITRKVAQDGQEVHQMLPLETDIAIMELKRQVQDLEDTYNCSICLERKKNVVFMCGHGACNTCATPLNNCHMCRELITYKINTF